ncbi:AzlD domain-containing protein [Simiduia agarivorans]|uniref:Branched-chain amino acid transport n=1 Tax=Simiduia agarivorans (strain DSM 21679 / JCM 13881 / BCRC 17597 / SA1) TaxID=1117647 RepID=K4KP59_SIMAS|nr:AzlD domain-containing protein [Simiduia agarivorans]AFV00807.1 branched-chain amino acid transport [Simiduia agarivorans SA1 = DSM 21679]
MSTELWLALAFSALVTFAMRAWPAVWMRTRLNQPAEASADLSAPRPMPLWLSVLGPTMIAAMTGVSLVPAVPDVHHAVASACGLLATLLAWWRTRSLGWPVVAGVVAFGVVYWLSR